MPRRESFSDEIRRAIEECGRSRYAICKALELSESAMSRFMSREQGLSLAVLDQLAELLDLHVTARKTRRMVKP